MCKRALVLFCLLPCCLRGGASGADVASSKQSDKQSEKEIEIVGQLVASDVPDKERRHPCKIHTFTFDKDKTYTIDLMSRDFDCWLRIADADGKTLTQDDDGGEGLNSRLRFTAARTGAYQVVATSCAGGAGAYLLKVRPDGAAGKPAAKPIVIKLDGAKIEAGAKAEFQGQLDPGDAPDPVRNRPAKVHTVRLAKDKTYIIELRSTDFDSYLRLEDAAGKQLAHDDDGAGFPNARLRFAAPHDGDYRLIATSFDGKTGRYTLRIAAE